MNHVRNGVIKKSQKCGHCCSLYCYCRRCCCCCFLTSGGGRRLSSKFVVVSWISGVVVIVLVDVSGKDERGWASSNLANSSREVWFRSVLFFFIVQAIFVWVLTILCCFFLSSSLWLSGFFFFCHSCCCLWEGLFSFLFQRLHPPKPEKWN